MFLNVISKNSNHLIKNQIGNTITNSIINPFNQKKLGNSQFLYQKKLLSQKNYHLLSSNSLLSNNTCLNKNKRDSYPLLINNSILLKNTLKYYSTNEKDNSNSVNAEKKSEINENKEINKTEKNIKNEAVEHDDKNKETNKKENNKKEENSSNGSWKKYTAFSVLGGISLGLGITYGLNYNLINQKIEDLKNSYLEKKEKLENSKNNEVFSDKNTEPRLDTAINNKNKNEKGRQIEIVVTEKSGVNKSSKKNNEGTTTDIPINKSNTKNTKKPVKKEKTKKSQKKNNEKKKNIEKNNKIMDDSIIIDINNNINDKSTLDSITSSAVDFYNYVTSFFGAEPILTSKDEQERFMSEIDKEIEDIYLEILNDISHDPNTPEITINNLENNKSIFIGKKELSDEKERKRIEKELKSWASNNDKDKNKTNKKNKDITSKKNKDKNNKNENTSISITTVDINKDGSKIYNDSLGTIVDISDDLENNRKIIRLSAKPIAKVFQEASKLSESLEKNKERIPDFLADCVKETTENIIKSDEENKDKDMYEQNLFSDTVKLFGESLNAISDYLDHLEIEIKTDLKENEK